MDAVAGSGRGMARSMSADGRDQSLFLSPAARAALRRRHVELPSKTLPLASCIDADALKVKYA